MNYSKKSWHYWLHTHVWSDDVPNNICAYIKNLMLTMIIVVPMTAFFLPFLLYKLILSLVKKETFVFPPYNYNFMSAFVAAFITLCLVPMTMMWFHVPKNLNVFLTNPHPMFQAGLLVWFLVIVFGIIFYYLFCIEEKEPKPKKIKKPNIFIEAYKSFKEKNCKRINWID